MHSWPENQGAISAMSFECLKMISVKAGVVRLGHCILPSFSHLETLVRKLWRLMCEPQDLMTQEKIDIIAKKMYGAGSVSYSDEADKDIERYNKLGFGSLPICMAKTQYSFSGEADKKGAPTRFDLLVNRVGASVGAGFLVPLIGEPQLPTLGVIHHQEAVIGPLPKFEKGRVNYLWPLPCLHLKATVLIGLCKRFCI